MTLTDYKAARPDAAAVVAEALAVGTRGPLWAEWTAWVRAATRLPLSEMPDAFRVAGDETRAVMEAVARGKA